MFGYWIYINFLTKLKMKHRLSLFKAFSLVVFGLLLFTACNLNDHIITSDFITDTEDWTITGDAQGEFSEASYAAEGGVTDGYIYAHDNVQGGVWYFTAPATYNGSKSEFYGATLQFSLLQNSKMSRQFISDDIIFKNGNNQITYVHDKKEYPGNAWTAYSIKINTEQGWFKGGYTSKVLATEAEIRAILLNITQFSIRGEFETGSDTGALDDVSISHK